MPRRISTGGSRTSSACAACNPRRGLPARPSGSRRSKPVRWSFGLRADAERVALNSGRHDSPRRVPRRRLRGPPACGRTGCDRQAVESGRSQRRQPRRRVPLGMFERCEVTRVAGVLQGRRGVVDRPDEPGLPTTAGATTGLGDVRLVGARLALSEPDHLETITPVAGDIISPCPLKPLAKISPRRTTRHGSNCDRARRPRCAR
jgi:hypothetical protein